MRECALPNSASPRTARGSACRHGPTSSHRYGHADLIVSTSPHRCGNTDLIASKGPYRPDRFGAWLAENARAQACVRMMCARDGCDARDALGEDAQCMHRRPDDGSARSHCRRRTLPSPRSCQHVTASAAWNQQRPLEPKKTPAEAGVFLLAYSEIRASGQACSRPGKLFPLSKPGHGHATAWQALPYRGK